MRDFKFILNRRDAEAQRKVISFKLCGPAPLRLISNEKFDYLVPGQRPRGLFFALKVAPRGHWIVILAGSNERYGLALETAVKPGNRNQG